MWQHITKALLSLFLLCGSFFSLKLYPDCVYTVVIYHTTYPHSTPKIFKYFNEPTAAVRATQYRTAPNLVTNFHSSAFAHFSHAYSLSYEVFFAFLYALFTSFLSLYRNSIGQKYSSVFMTPTL